MYIFINYLQGLYVLSPNPPPNLSVLSGYSAGYIIRYVGSRKLVQTSTDTFVIDIILYTTLLVMVKYVCRNTRAASKVHQSHFVISKNT